ncbi:hypothetical protein [Photobacterium kagoshimensis]|uniref:hypothetical protein n=1 Tax=Photobacterium kagoshimensis TaxID=2910242 RepID=UPI003D0C8F6D
MKQFNRFISQWVIAALLMTFLPLSASASVIVNNTAQVHTIDNCCSAEMMQQSHCMSMNSDGDSKTTCQNSDCHSTTASAILFAHQLTVSTMTDSHNYGDPVSQLFNYSERILRPPVLV